MQIKSLCVEGKMSQMTLFSKEEREQQDLRQKRTG